MIESVAQKSKELFESGYLCAESVLFAMAESQGIESDLIPDIASGFCAGLSRTCGLCGAVAGAIMGIGLIKGRSVPDDPVDPTFNAVQALIQSFTEEFGSTNCQELTDCDFSCEEGREKFIEKNQREQCYIFTQKATEIAMKLVGKE